MARLGCLATLFVLLYSSALLVSAECPLPNITQIETAMMAFGGPDGAPSLDPTIMPPVHYVCLAQGNMINNYRYLSVIATYIPIPTKPEETNIFQLICSNGVWAADTNRAPEAPDPSVENVTRYDCVQCSHNNGPDRCRPCNAACNTGLRRCTGLSSSDCCLYFDRNGQCTRDNCTVSSGPNYIATASNNFTCTCNLICLPGHTLNSSSCECIFTSICDRDSPCENGGNCIQYSPATNYTCDCTGTGYEGVNCTTELIPSPSPSIITATTSSSATTPSPSPPVCSVSNCADCETSSCCKTCSAGFYLNSDNRCSCGPCRVPNCLRCRPLNSSCCAPDSCEDGYVLGSDNCQCEAPSSTTVEPPKPTVPPTDDTIGFSSEGLAGLIVGLILGILLLLTLAAVIAYVIYYFVVGGGAGVNKAKSKSPFANGESHNNPLYLAPDEVAAL